VVVAIVVVLVLLIPLLIFWLELPPLPGGD
jgi:hypothetical protein